jgi:hypothetical protein
MSRRLSTKKEADLSISLREANFATAAMHYRHNNVYKSRTAAAMPTKKQIRSARPPTKDISFERVFTDVMS